MVLLRFFVIGVIASTSWADDTPAAILRKMEELRRKGGPSLIEGAWPYLNAESSAVREAARKAVQTRPFETWKGRALEEKETWASLELLRALAESCPKAEAPRLSPHLCEQITTLRIEQMDEAQLLAALKVTRFIFDSMGPLSDDERHQMLDLWTGLPRPGHAATEKERQQLLEFLRTVAPRHP